MLIERLWIEGTDERVVKRFDILGVQRESEVVAGHGGNVVKTRLENVGLCLEELHLRIEDVELGAGAGIQALLESRSASVACTTLAVWLSMVSCACWRLEIACCTSRTIWRTPLS